MLEYLYNQEEEAWKLFKSSPTDVDLTLITNPTYYISIKKTNLGKGIHYLRLHWIPNISLEIKHSQQI